MEFESAVGANQFFGSDRKPAVGTGCRMDISERRTTGNAVTLPDGVRCSAEFTGNARQTIRKCMGGGQCDSCLVNHLPNVIVELDALDILGEIVQAVEQAKWIAQRRKRGLPDTRRDPEPRLFANVDHHPILNGLEGDRESSLSAGHGAQTGGNLYRHFVFRARYLGVEIATIEFCHQRMCNVIGLDVAVKNSPVHLFDYNPSIPRRQFVVAFHIS